MEPWDESAETRRKRLEKHRTRPRRLAPSIQPESSQTPPRSKKKDSRNVSPTSSTKPGSRQRPKKEDTRKKRFKEFLQNVDGDKRKQYFSVASIASATDTSATVSLSDQSRSSSVNKTQQILDIQDPPKIPKIRGKEPPCPENLTLRVPSDCNMPCKDIKENVPFDEPNIPSSASEGLETGLQSVREIVAARNSASPTHTRSLESTDNATFLYSIRSGFDSEYGATSAGESSRPDDDSYFIFSDQSDHHQILSDRSEYDRSPFDQSEFLPFDEEEAAAAAPRGFKLGCCSLVDNDDGSTVQTEATPIFIKECEAEVVKANECCMEQTEKTRDFCLSLCEDELRGLTFGY